MAGNMEDLLFRDDDDDSDDDVGQKGPSIPENNGNGSVPTPFQASIPAPAPVLGQSDLKARLKSLYQPANKAPAPAPMHQPVSQQVPNPMQRPSQSQQQVQQQGAPMQRHPSQQMQPPHYQQHHQPRQQPTHQQQPIHMPRSAAAPVPHQSNMPSSRMLAQHQPQPQSAATLTQQRPLVSSHHTPDPFEPTPLTVTGSRPSSQQQHRTVAPAQAPISSHGSSSHVSGHPSMHSSSRPDRATFERNAKKAKEQFLLFTRVLMKYLENKDAAMHTRAKNVIKECAERNKNKEPGYESVTASMNKRLRQTVGESYWKKAEGYLAHFQKRRKDEAAAAQSKQADPNQVAPTQYSQQAQQQQKQQQLSLQQKQQQMQKIMQEKKDQLAADSARQKQQQEETNRKNRQEEQKAQQAKLQKIKDSNSKQIAALNAQTKQQRAAAAAAAAATPAPKRKSSVSGSSSTVNATAPARTKLPEPDGPPQEYNEFMNLLDHAVDYDWKSSGLFLGSQSDVNLNAEQRTLLYGSSAPRSLPSKGIRPGWNTRNIVTSRVAWAKVRLPELQCRLKESNSTTPVVAGISLPGSKPPIVNTTTTWVNEETAERDPTLAVLSEATEIYLKQILNKALHCARQRENLEGIRLWHMQHSGSKPPISIRLGCDVSRQIALANGNAARTVQRMEEALERCPVERCDLKDPMVLAEAMNMADLACRPKLASAAEKANYNAKRSFEISGGKESTEPPFGRVPKQAKIMAHDFQLGMELVQHRAPRTVSLNFV